MIRSNAPYALLACAVSGLLVSGVALAQDAREKELKKQLDTMVNESAPIPERMDAVTKVGGAVMVQSTPAKAKEQCQQAFDTLLRQQLAGKPRSKELEDLAKRAFERLRQCFPNGFPELAKVARPYLKEKIAAPTNPTKVAVLQAVEACGAPGLGPDLVAIFELPYETAKPHRERERIEIEKAAIRAARGLPGNEALDVLQAAVTRSKIEGNRLQALREIGDFALTRKPRDFDKSRVVNFLRETSKQKVGEANVGAQAALSGLRHNSFDGVQGCLDRLEGKSGLQACDYKVLCIAAQKPDGFNALNPKDFESVATDQQQAAVKEASGWFANAKTTTPERVLFDTLAAQSINVPKDPSSKEYLDKLLDALLVRERITRYAVLDIVVQRTGKTDFAQRYKYLHSEVGANIFIDDHEPEDGYNEPSKAADLLNQQDERTRALKKQWDSVKDKATYDNGVWNATWPPLEKDSTKKGSK